MKKLLLFIFLLVPPLVSAQPTIVFLGREYQLIIFIPLILIALSSAILIILYFFEYYKKITEIKKIVKIKGILTLIFSLIRFKKKRKPIKEEKEVDLKKRIISLQENLSKLSPKNILAEITLITKDFYRYNLNIKPILTEIELKNTLKKNQTDIIEFSEKLSEVTYNGQEITKEKVKNLYDNLYSLIKKYTPRFALEKKEREVIKTKRNFKRIKKQLLTNAKYNLQSIKNTFLSIRNYIHKIGIKSKKQKILLLINQGKHLLENNSPSARNFYIKALLSYYKLRLQEEREIYSELEDFHNELNKRGHGKKDLTELSRKIINLKHNKKQKEGLKFFKQLKNYIRDKEKLNIRKLQKYSTVLKEGEQNLIKDIKELEHYAIKKKREPLLYRIKKLRLRYPTPKKQIFEIPEVKLTPPPQPKIKLSKRMSKLFDEKNMIYNKLLNLEKETRQYEKETNIPQKHFFTPQKLYIPKETPQIIKKYNPHKNLTKLLHEKELITKKLTSLR